MGSCLFTRSDPSKDHIRIPLTLFTVDLATPIRREGKHYESPAEATFCITPCDNANRMLLNHAAYGLILI